MHIAYVLNTYPQPSHSFIRREIRALERQGFTITRMAMRRADVVLVDAMDRDEAARTSHILEAGGLHLMLALLRAAITRPARFWRALILALRLGAASDKGRLRHLIYLAEAAEVARRCARAGISHCHAHFGTNATTVAMLAAALGGPGYSFTVHGPEEFDAPAALSLATKITRARFCVAISQFGRSQLCRLVDHSDWDRIKVVHCGIEKSRFETVTPAPEAGLNLVAIGRFVEQKGQMVLIPAMAMIKARIKGTRLHLVGDGPGRAALETAIAAQGLQDNITLTGWLDEAAVRRELDAAHALIMPSFAEGLPMVVMEAMAAARPVLATHIAGTPELVQPGKTGWLVPAGDPQALAEAALELAAMDARTRAAMGDAGRARVFARHDVDNEAAKLAAHFRNLS